MITISHLRPFICQVLASTARLTPSNVFLEITCR